MSTLQIIVAFAEMAFVVFFLLNIGGIMTWVERKEAAMIQDRIGANRAAIQFSAGPLKLLNPILAFIARLGLLHPLADGVKMFTKEYFVPDHIHKTLYHLAPFLAVMPALITFMAVPFGPDVTIPTFTLLGWTIEGGTVPLQVIRIDGGLLYVFAFAGLGVYSAALAGWASGNKFALLGSIRASAQMISYEISMGLSLIGLFMIFGTIQPHELVEGQGKLIGGVIPMWGIVVQPLAFFLYLTSAIAETKRAPFDLAEGESEIVAGYFLEYSGMNFGAFYMAEFIEVVVASAIVTTLFLGGWQIPYLQPSGFVFPWGQEIMLSTGVVTALGIAAFFTKVFFMAWFQVLLRWSLPRFRFDQVISLGWKIMFPLALANVLVTAIVLQMLR